MTASERIPRLLRRPLLDIRLGFVLMRDSRVPFRFKLLAVMLGLAITGLVEFLELPVEGLLSMVLPFLGAAGDVAFDGVETIAGPVILAVALLPLLAPRDIVERIHSERSTSTGERQSPIIDL
jgi:hypothetical protein